MSQIDDLLGQIQAETARLQACMALHPTHPLANFATETLRRQNQILNQQIIDVIRHVPPRQDSQVDQTHALFLAYAQGEVETLRTLTSAICG